MRYRSGYRRRDPLAPAAVCLVLPLLLVALLVAPLIAPLIASLVVSLAAPVAPVGWAVSGPGEAARPAVFDAMAGTAVGTVSGTAAIRSAEHDAEGRAWPVDGVGGSVRPMIVKGWEPPPSPYAAGHRGVDLAARPGRTVRAAGAGRVAYTGSVAGRRVLSLELDDTRSPPLRITYQPVRASVRKGDRVAAGQPVGTLDDGPFHCPSGCLHWGLLRGKRYLDPLSLLPARLLRGGPSRLLPVFGALGHPAGQRFSPGHRAEPSTRRPR